MSDDVWLVEFDVEGEFFDCETCGYTYKYLTVETDDFVWFHAHLRFGCTGSATFGGHLDEVITWVEAESQTYGLKRAVQALRDLQSKLKASGGYPRSQDKQEDVLDDIARWDAYADSLNKEAAEKEAQAVKLWEIIGRRLGVPDENLGKFIQDCVSERSQTVEQVVSDALDHAVAHGSGNVSLWFY